MKVLIAPDTFKGAASAVAVAEAIRKGIHLVDDSIDCQLLPLADGGEGTAEILVNCTHGQLYSITVNDPLGRPIQASYGISGDGKTAFVDMASASGLTLLQEEERSAMHTTSMGTGTLLLAALDQGVERLVMGIGGSATNDMGMGMAKALGYRFLDEKGEEIFPTGSNLGKVSHIDAAQVSPLVKQVSITIACDVTNPLYGEEGAAYVYARQKGATEAEIEELDRGMRSMAAVVERELGVAIAEMAGAGAAGGMGGGAVAFLGAELKHGMHMIGEITQAGRANCQSRLSYYWRR